MTLQPPEERAAAHPQPPWWLTGRALIVPGLAPARRAGTASRLLELLPGRSLGGLLLARYEASSTLEYSELLGIGGLARAGPGAGLWIPFARVDDVPSMAAGRSVWGLPKRAAHFSWSETAGEISVSVEDAEGPLVRARALVRAHAWPLPLVAPYVAADGDRLTLAHGWLVGAPTRVRVHVAAGSALDALGLALARVGLVGEVRLRIPEPLWTSSP